MTSETTNDPALQDPALERIADALEEIVMLLKRLTFVDYGGYQDGKKALNLRVFINAD